MHSSLRCQVPLSRCPSVFTGEGNRHACSLKVANRYASPTVRGSIRSLKVCVGKQDNTEAGPSPQLIENVRGAAAIVTAAGIQNALIGFAFCNGPPIVFNSEIAACANESKMIGGLSVLALALFASSLVMQAMRKEGDNI